MFILWRDNIHIVAQIWNCLLFLPKIQDFILREPFILNNSNVLEYNRKDFLIILYADLSEAHLEREETEWSINAKVCILVYVLSIVQSFEALKQATLTFII